MEKFSGEAQSFERGSNLYAQVTPDLRGGFEVAQPNAATASNYLPEVQLQDSGANFISAPRRLGGDERRKAAEKEQKPNETPKQEQPKENKPQQQEQKPNETPKQEQPKENKPKQQEQKPNETPKQEQPKENKPQQQEQKPNETPKKEQPKENKPQQQEQKPNETPKKEQPQTQPGPKAPERQDKPKDCVDYNSRGAKVMEKPTNWTPDTELKTKQGQEWNKHAKELRDKPLKTDKDGNYEVQYGDSLWGIAERSVKGKTGKAASPAETFAEMQRIVGMNADKLGSQSNWQMIKPGMQLRIKGDNPCEVPSQNGAPQERPRVAQNDAPRERPRVAQTDVPPGKPRVAQNDVPREQRPRVAQNDAPQERPRVAQGDAPGERTTVGDKGQKVTVDAQERVTKIDYPNGIHVKFEYSGASKEISKAAITGNGQDVLMVKNGDHYKVFEKRKETSDKVLSIEVKKDGSAVITGTSSGMKGQKIVRTDGSTENKYLGNAA